jgi:hypothetical protein
MLGVFRYDNLLGYRQVSTYHRFVISELLSKQMLFDFRLVFGFSIKLSLVFCLVCGAL